MAQPQTGLDATTQLRPLEWLNESVELRGFATGVHQIQWLLVSLVMLYLVSTGGADSIEWPTLITTLAYFGYSVLTSWHSGARKQGRWLLAIHTWVMIAFITAFLYYSRELEGPLVNLYLLAVITSALALGKLVTLLEVGAIASCYLLLLYHLRGLEAIVGPELTVPAAYVAMFVIIGYLTTVLADAIRMANVRLQRLAHTDQLTGLFNRHTLYAIVQPLYATALRQNRPFAIMMADMDKLKHINDRYGHVAGDEAITHAARRFRRQMRKTDVPARFGGDEFLIFLPDTSAEGAGHLAQRVLEDDSQPASGAPGAPLSIGVAGYPEHGSTIAELAKKADTAMYASKRAGGNRVTIYHEELGDVPSPDREFIDELLVLQQEGGPGQ